MPTMIHCHQNNTPYIYIFTIKQSHCIQLKTKNQKPKNNTNDEIL